MYHLTHNLHNVGSLTYDTIHPKNHGIKGGEMGCQSWLGYPVILLIPETKQI